MQSEILADSQDFFNTRLRYIIPPILAVYALMTFFGHHNTTQTIDAFVSSSRDVGLAMTLKAQFPVWILNLHSLAAMMLTSGCLFQKQSVLEMAATKGSKFIEWKTIHKSVGNVVLVLTFLMDLGGLLMGRYSKFDDFPIFNMFFAAPWAFWIVGIYWSATAARIRIHRLLTNMLLKGCCSVPFSRAAGAALQQMGWEETRGYYQGILGVTVVVSIWQFADLYNFYIESKPTNKHSFQPSFHLSEVHTSLLEKCNRPIPSCGIDADLPRLVNKIHIIDHTQTKVFPKNEKPQTQGPTYETVYEYLTTLAQQFKVEDQLMKIASETPVQKDLTTEIDRIICALGEDSPITKILKATGSQGIVAPFFMFLKLSLLPRLDYRDSPNSWRIEILFTEQQVTVIHKKTELGVPPKLSDLEFSWELALIFDRRSMKLISSSGVISKMKWSTKQTKAEIEALEAAVKPWYKKQVLVEK